MSYTRSVSSGLSVHVMYQVSVEMVVCTCHTSGQYGLGCLCMSYIRLVSIGLSVHVIHQVSVNWVVCATHISRSVSIGLSVHVAY